MGAWVNVVGYVEGLDGEEGSRRAKEKGGSVGKEDVGVEQVDGGVVRVRVKAVMLWSAGGVKIGDYERAVEGRMRAERGC